MATRTETETEAEILIWFLDCLMFSPLAIRPYERRHLSQQWTPSSAPAFLDVFS